MQLNFLLNMPPDSKTGIPSSRLQGTLFFSRILNCLTIESRNLGGRPQGTPLRVASCRGSPCGYPLLATQFADLTVNVLYRPAA